MSNEKIRWDVEDQRNGKIVGSFSTQKEAWVKACSLLSLDPDSWEAEERQNCDENFPLLTRRKSAPLREAVPLELVLEPLLPGLIDDLGETLQEVASQTLAEEFLDYVQLPDWEPPTLSPEALRRIAIALREALEREGIALPEDPVDWIDFG